MGAALVLMRYPLTGIVIDGGDGRLPWRWWFLTPCCEKAGPLDLRPRGGKCTSHAAAVTMGLSCGLRSFSPKEET